MSVEAAAAVDAAQQYRHNLLYNKSDSKDF
jgi:hypothetical protein